jgi:ATP-dependent helicase/nuclease subunit B
LPEGFLIHGVIDLAEKNGGAERRITDHKTGKNRTKEGMVVGGGEVLQPVLYSLSFEDLRKTTVKEARLSYCTAAEGYTERTVVMDKASRKAAIDVLRGIDAAIGKGFLPAAPEEDGCDWCDFAQVCGPYEEIRVGRKRSEGFGAARDDTGEISRAISGARLISSLRSTSASTKRICSARGSSPHPA